MDKQGVSRLIDSTLLKPFASHDDIRRLCVQAMRFEFFSVCVNPIYVSLAARELDGSHIRICTVAGFPLGTHKKETKAFETKRAIRDGADEIDMVMNLGALKSRDYKSVTADIDAVVRAAEGRPVKVIIETCFLTDEEKSAACKIILGTGAAFVKTSTGFGTHGATEADIRLMRTIVGGALKIKAAGGIQTLKDLLHLVDAGADRIGTSRGVEIVSEMK